MSAEASIVLSRRPHFNENGRLLSVRHWYPRRGYVETERYRRIDHVVHEFVLPDGLGHSELRRAGFHPVTLFLRDGNYFSREWSRGRSRSAPVLRPVMVWQRGGELFRVALPGSRLSEEDH